MARDARGLLNQMRLKIENIFPIVEVLEGDKVWLPLIPLGLPVELQPLTFSPPIAFN